MILIACRRVHGWGRRKWRLGVVSMLGGLEISVSGIIASGRRTWVGWVRVAGHWRRWSGWDARIVVVAAVHGDVVVVGSV